MQIRTVGSPKIVANTGSFRVVFLRIIRSETFYCQYESAPRSYDNNNERSSSLFDRPQTRLITLLTKRRLTETIDIVIVTGITGVRPFFFFFVHTIFRVQFSAYNVCFRQTFKNVIFVLHLFNIKGIVGLFESFFTIYIRTELAETLLAF